MAVARISTSVLAGAAANVALAVLLVGCGGSAPSASPESAPDSANDGSSILDDLRSSALNVTDDGPLETVAYAPIVVPADYAVTRASASSAEFMSIELTDADSSISLMWGNELSGFELIAEADPASFAVDVGGESGQAFTFASDAGAGPAVLWNSSSGTPVLVIGSPDVAVEVVLDVANGVTETSQDEFIDLAGRLAMARLEGEIETDLRSDSGADASHTDSGGD